MIAAWGAHGTLHGRAAQVATRLHCLGTTSGGQPLHPLYLRGDTPLAPYTPPA